VRYTAKSGARVFAAGAQQWSWSLDTFELNQHGRTLPPDSRLQQFMRNALADLTRPAAPAAVTVSLVGRTATIHVRRRADPRVQRVDVFRHAGSGTFAPGQPGVVRICRSTGADCLQRRLFPGTYRFAGVAVDRWGESLPALSRPIVVR